MESTTNIFLSYAHQDKKFAEQLGYFLRSLEMQGLATVWSTNKIKAGEKWDAVIKKHLNTAQIILLLVSPNYLASNSLEKREIDKLIMEKVKEHKVIPVLLKPVSLKSTPLEDFASLPQGKKPVSQWSNRDMAFLDITESIRSLVNDLEEEHAPSLTNMPQTIHQAEKWEQDLASSALYPYQSEFEMLNNRLRLINECILSYKKKFLVSDDPKQKFNVKYSIEELENEFNEAVSEYNALREKLKLPPRSKEDVRKLFHVL
jgi:hypothetical protein